MKGWCAIWLALVCGTMLVSTPARADWERDVQGWQVGRSGQRCVARMTYEGAGETELAIATDGIEDQVFLLTTNYGWTSIKDQTYRIDYRLGGAVYSGPAFGMINSYRKGFRSKFALTLLDDLRRAGGIVMERDGVLVDDLSLAGSAAMLVVFARCRREIVIEFARAKALDDKFSHIPKDPFVAPAGASTTLAPAALPTDSEKMQAAFLAVVKGLRQQVPDIGHSRFRNSFFRSIAVGPSEWKHGVCGEIAVRLPSGGFGPWRRFYGDIAVTVVTDSAGLDRMCDGPGAVINRGTELSALLARHLAGP